MYPVREPITITSPFGQKRNFPPFGPHIHDGVDIVNGAPGEVHHECLDVIAVCDGVVCSDRDDYEHAKRWTDRHDSVGNRIVQKSVIDGKTVFIAYYHMASNNVSEGDTIKKGQVIGKYGDVGMSYGAHIHLIAWDEKWHVIDSTFLLEV